jgi:type VI protein secretion system component VasF
MPKREILWERVFFRAVYYTLVALAVGAYLWWCHSIWVL